MGAGSTQGPAGATSLQPADGAGSRPPIEPGTPVEVRNRFEGTWVRGFCVAGMAEDGSYLVRRISDGSILPGSFERGAIRRERRRRTGWWY
ncbi:MAG: hypothetical protein ACYDHU_09570 [Acidimicrobiales bacterium]